MTIDARGLDAAVKQSHYKRNMDAALDRIKRDAATIVRLNAEVERMREALTEIAQPVVCPPYDLDEAFAQREAIRDIARIATKESPND